MSLEPGASFGPYRIETPIGRGGMGAVYLATDTRLGRRVALKFLATELAAQASFRDRFISESRIAASLDHPHVVPIYESGEIDGQLFIAMRYVPGVHLGELARSAGPLPLDRAVRIISQVADALDAAHAAGLVHRDVKPGNVLIATTIGGADHAYLTDFGLTKQAAPGMNLTRTGQVIGTVDYLAPEQIEGRAVDRRADVYSLACVLFEIVAGSPPYAKDTEIATLFAHVQAEPPPLRDVRPDAPPALDEVLTRAMAKDPDARYQSAGGLAEAAMAAIGQAAKPLEHGARGFLFADLRGYTSFVESRGDDEAAQLLERYRRLTRSVIERSQGAEIRTEGDSFYVVFSSAGRAVAAGIELVAEAAKRSEHEPEYPIEVGVGIHAGETADTAEGPVGSAVNIAARICGQARAGEVLVSDTVRGLTRTRGGVAFEPVGSRRLKGVAERFTLYRAVPTTAGAVAARPTTRWSTLASGEQRPLLIGAAVIGVLAAVTLAALAALGLGAMAPDGTVSPAANSTPVPLATVSPPAAGPASGTRIVYSRQAPIVPDGATCDEGTDGRLYVANPDDPEAAHYRLTRETDLFERAPEWSADGSVIVFVGNVQNAPPGVFRVSASEAELSAVQQRSDSLRPFGDPRLAIAPDGSYVLWSQSEAIWRVPVAGGPAELVLGIQPPDMDHPEDDEQSPLEPAEFFHAVGLMPDGSLLMAVEPIGTGRARLEMAKADGTDRQPLEFDLGGRFVNGMSIAPDGDLLALEAATEAEGEMLLVGRLSEGGSDLRRIAPDLVSPRHPSFSPDGAQIAFHAGDRGSEGVYVADVESGYARRLTDPGDALGCAPSWSVAPPDLAGPHPTPAPGGPQVFERGALPAGTYLLSLVQPNMELTVPDGWYARRNYVDGWVISHISDEPEEVASGRIQVGMTGPCFDDEQVVLGPRPNDLVDWLQTREDLVVDNVRPINLGGYPGLAVDIAPREGMHCERMEDNRLWVLFETGQDVDIMREGDRIRLIAVDVVARPCPSRSTASKARWTTSGRTTRNRSSRLSDSQRVSSDPRRHRPPFRQRPS
ncbi:hypothetical protein BH23CHL7_BH23CHL7_05000 [soil metagenome]